MGITVTIKADHWDAAYSEYIRDALESGAWFIGDDTQSEDGDRVTRRIGLERYYRVEENGELTPVNARGKETNLSQG